MKGNLVNKIIKRQYHQEEQLNNSRNQRKKDEKSELQNFRACSIEPACIRSARKSEQRVGESESAQQ